MAMYPRGILVIIIILIRAHPLPSTRNTPWLTINNIVIKEVRGTSDSGLGWVGEMKEGAAMGAAMVAGGEVDMTRSAQDG